ncbi:MAG TPA: tRNA pseudouridine(55) synthase TruB [Vicinamibacterales bacterium]|jgi:tRNA pseudouridine55 synthase|nr:tRNA pseudouridine(55) synthase TruB [Vicinamibacterales bacterium]
MNGVLVVDKPSGPTSHDVVARVRRAIGIDRIGHTGTLDPLATGVLPLVIGRATRLAQYLTADDKEYVAGIRFGAVSSTYDALGLLTAAVGGATDVDITRASLEQKLEQFRGSYEQIPPPFSAKKVAGTRAYRLARSQQPVTLKPVQVTVSLLELLSLDGVVAVVRLGCSSGYYVRSLAHELGQRLGCGAFLQTLQRTRAGSFRIEEAVPLATVESEKADAARRITSMNRLLPGIPGLTVTSGGIRRVSHGNSLSPEDFEDAAAASAILSGPADRNPVSRIRIVDPEGALLAIGEARPGGLLHPVVVLM